jgi:hypothetical protein
MSQLPLDVYQAAAAAQLGEQPRAEYHVKTKVSRIISGILLIVIGVACGAGGLASVSTLQDTSSLLVLLLLGLAALLLIAGGLYAMFYAVIYKNWAAYLYERGFVHKKGNEAAQPFRWDQIEAVWYHVTRHYRNGVYTGTTHNYRVRRQDGYQITLTDRFADVASLGDAVNNQVTAAKIPLVIAAYNAGQTITFGPLTLSQQGIRNSIDNLLPWSEIKEVSLRNGYVAVSKAGKWLKWSSQPVRNIPNIFLFMALVRFVLKK